MTPWLALAVIVAVRIALGLQFQSVGSLGPFLLDALAIDYASLGLLIGIVQLPQAVMALPAGWLNARLGDRMLCVGGLALMTAGALVLAGASGLGLALAGRLLMGVGSVALTIVMSKLVFDRFSGPSIPIAMGFLMAAWPGGQALALATLPPLAQMQGWRVAMAATAVFSALGLVAMALLLRTPSRRTVPQLSRLRPGELAPLLAAALSWTLLNCALNILAGYGPAYFTATGLDAAQAGALVGLLTLPLTLLLPVGGFLARLLRRPALAVVWLLLAMAATALAIPATPWPGATMVLLGTLMALPSAYMVSQQGNAVSAESRAIGLGLSLTVLGICTTALPPIAGWIRDSTAAAAAPIYVAVACFLACAVAQIALILLQSRRTATAT